MLVIFIAISIALAALAFSFGGVDFGVYYAAARVTLHGGNPYDYQQLAPQIVSNAGKINNPYYYAPWFTWTLLPLAFFPYNIARALWAIINFILWFWALYNLSKLIKYPFAGWGRWGMYLLVTFVFAWSTWGSEQVGVLILFLFTLAILSAERGKWGVAGIWLALLLFKPNITAIPVGMIVLWILLRKKEWRPALVMVGTLVVLIFISLIVSPNWHLAFFQMDKLQGLSYTLDSSGTMNIKRYTTTLLDWLAAYGVEGGAVTAIYGMVIIFGIVAATLGMYYSASVVEFAAVIILVNFAVVPYALFYDYPALTLTLFYTNGLLLQKPSFIWIRYAANALIVFSLFVGGVIPYRYWIIIILVFFIGLGYFTNRQTDNRRKNVRG